MFSIGDLVVYGQTGVCRITDICEKEITPKNVKKYYALKPIYQQNSVIYCPVDNDKISIRNIISKQEAKNLIELIPSIKTTKFFDGEQRAINEMYSEAIKSQSLEELITLTMAIYQKKQLAKENNKKLGSVDERYMQRAEDLLFGELACALGIDINDVERYIEETLA